METSMWTDAGEAELKKAIEEYKVILIKDGIH